MKFITLYVPEAYLKKIEELKDLGFVPNRAEGLRIGARLLVEEHIKFGHIKSPIYKKTPAKKNPFDQSLENLFIL